MRTLLLLLVLPLTSALADDFSIDIPDASLPSAVEAAEFTDDEWFEAIEEFISSLRRPFSTDFCSMYPEGTRKKPNLWRDCCVEHDLKLWAGGTRKERRQADRELRACVAEKSTKLRALIMYIGVRLASLSPFKFKGYWGNAWQGRVRKKPLTPKEVDAIEDALKKTKIESLTDEIKSKLIRTLRLRLASPA